MTKPALRSITREGTVVDGELAIELANGGREFISIDGDLFALFEGQRVRVAVEVIDHAETDRADGTGGAPSVPH